MPMILNSNKQESNHARICRGIKTEYFLSSDCTLHEMIKNSEEYCSLKTDEVMKIYHMVGCSFSVLGEKRKKYYYWFRCEEDKTKFMVML